jgi:hypothetical protein
LIASDAYRIAEESASRLVISVPGASLLAGWLGCTLGVILLLTVYLTSRTVARVTAVEKSPEQAAQFVLRYRIAGVAITAGALLFFWAVSYSSGSITMDRATNQAVVQAKMTAFLPAQTLRAPLADVQSATLDTKPNSRRIRLLTNSGSDVGYPMWSSRTGQDEAVSAINHFLGGR